MDSTEVSPPCQPEERLSITRQLGHRRWTICAFLFAATSINYMDRQVIAILKPTLQQSIGMTEVNYGYIVVSFQIAYALGLLAAGRFVDKVGTRIGYIVVMATWSLAAMGHALANTVLEFGVARFLLGVGESGNFPAAIKVVAEWFPQNERALAIGIFNSGVNLGAILAPLVVPLIALHFGWHAPFLITGGFSAIWIFLWFLNYREIPETTAGERFEAGADNGHGRGEIDASISWTQLLGYRQTWAFALGKFLTDPIWWFYLFWLPSYFSTRFHLDLSHLGLPLILIYNASTIGSVAGGWLPGILQRSGLSTSSARLTAMTVCAFLVVPVVGVNYLHSEWAAIALLSLATGAHCGWSANLFTTPSDMFPRANVGSVTGIGGMAGSVGAVLLSASAGYILQFTHSYASLFVVAAGAYPIALVAILLLAPGLKKAVPRAI